MTLSAESILSIRESLPKPIHTLYMAASLWADVRDTFESGQQLGFGSIRIFASAYLPRNLMIGIKGSNNEAVLIRLGKLNKEERI